MATKPTKVELIEDGRTITLFDSHFESLDDRDDYNGRADSARIFGPKGSMVTFYDDQQFRKGQNFVRIEKKVDEPIEVPIATNFVKRPAEPDGEFHDDGTVPTYKWQLFKRVHDDPSLFDQILEKTLAHSAT